MEENKIIPKRRKFFRSVAQKLFELNIELYKMKENKEEKLHDNVYLPAILDIQNEAKIFLEKVKEFDDMVYANEIIERKRKEMEEIYKKYKGLSGFPNKFTY